MFGADVFGSSGAFIYSLVVSISALGALNANVFATGRLCAAAGKRCYFPGILSNDHFERNTAESTYYHRRLRRCSPGLVKAIVWFANWTFSLRLEKEVPM